MVGCGSLLPVLFGFGASVFGVAGFCVVEGVLCEGFSCCLGSRVLFRWCLAAPPAGCCCLLSRAAAFVVCWVFAELGLS